MQFALLFVSLTDPVPTDNQVKAGPAAAIVFVLLMLAIAVLGFSLRRQFKKVQAAKEAGVFGEDDESPAEGVPADEARRGTEEPSGETASDTDAGQSV